MYISRICAIDYSGRINKIELEKGLNIITGDSQTGKTALMEIVDYCLLNSENNIPKGKVDETIKIYFIILIKNDKKIVVAREKFDSSKERNGKSKAFLKYEDINFQENLINSEYFDINKEKFKPIQELKIDFLNIFNINVLERIGSDNKIQRPTHRNIMSFIFQTQGTIANKENLFYRMNDARKRKNLIEELPILLGFVNQEYNIKRLDKLEIEKNIKKIDERIKYSVEEFEILKKDIEEEWIKLKEFESVHKILISDEKVRINILNQKRGLEKNLYDKSNELLEIEVRLEDMKDISEEKIKLVNKIGNRLKSEFSEVSNCPFCNSKLEELNEEIQNLQKIKNEYTEIVSIESVLNTTLINSKTELEKQKKERKKEVKDLNEKYYDLLSILNEEENKNEKIKEDIEYKKIKINALEKRRNDLCISNLKKELDDLKKELYDLNIALKEVDISDKMKRVNVEIAQEMERIISHLDFENYSEYPMININLEKLEYYQMSDKEKIYLSAMGSGSNWVAVHLALFLSLNYIFSKYSSTMSIPNILFLDQPSQAYFPKKEMFVDNKKLNAYEKVENIFIQVLNHIKYTKERTGLKPQIILIDHADNLNLGNEYNFEDYVKARWINGEGFIKL